MERSLIAVLAGTFTLRFSTGLTGAMLAAYLANLPDHGGQVVAATILALLHAAFYLAELVLSPIFGVLSDRLGHHRVMLYGPIFGAVAVVLTGLTTQLPILGVTRLLEGASTAASVPSILGFIAAVTAGNELLRGKAAARFEGATLAGLGVGFIVAPILFAAIGPTAFFLNAAFYGVSFLIYRTASRTRAGNERPSPPPRAASDFGRYLELLRSLPRLAARPDLDRRQRVDRAVVQPVALPVLAGQPDFPDQVLMRGFDRSRSRWRPSRSRSSSASGCSTGATGSVDAADHDHPVRHPGRWRARRLGAGRQPRGGLLAGRAR